MVFHKSAEEHFCKLRKNFERLEKEASNKANLKVNLADFFKEAWHLIEITKKDKNTSKDQKRRAASFRNDPDFKLCQAICNSEKHLNPNRGAITVRVSAKSMWATGQPAKISHEVSESQMVVKSNRGDRIDPTELARCVFSKWQSVFSSA